MSASALRYAPRPERNVALSEPILALGHRHKRHGVGMIYLKLRQEGMLVNYKRVERLYQEAKLQVRRRQRQKVPAGERQPLLRPMAASEVWSMDFVLDRTAQGQVAISRAKSSEDVDLWVTKSNSWFRLITAAGISLIGVD